MIDRSNFEYAKQPSGICVLFSFAKAIDALTDHKYDYNQVIKHFCDCIKIQPTNDVSHTYLITHLYPYLLTNGLSGIQCKKLDQPQFEDLRNQDSKCILCLSFSHGPGKDWHIVNVGYDQCPQNNAESYYIVDPNKDHPVDFDYIMNTYKINHFGDCLLFTLS